MGAGMRAMPNDERNYAAIHPELFTNFVLGLVAPTQHSLLVYRTTPRSCTGSIMRRLLIHHRFDFLVQVHATPCESEEYEMSTFMMDNRGPTEGA